MPENNKYWGLWLPKVKKWWIINGIIYSTQSIGLANLQREHILQTGLYYNIEIVVKELPVS